MMRDILGILSDFVGIIFLWWHPDALSWPYKVGITAMIVLLAIIFHKISRDRRVAKVKDYLWGEREDACITLISNKNTYYLTGMLVSIYTESERCPILCAIGYVKSDPKNSNLHIQVVHQIDPRAMSEIRNSPKSYKRFFAEPSVKQKDISTIKWG